MKDEEIIEEIIDEEYVFDGCHHAWVADGLGHIGCWKCGKTYYDLNSEEE